MNGCSLPEWAAHEDGNLLRADLFVMVANIIYRVDHQNLGNGGGSWVEAKPHQSFRQKPQPPASGRPAPRKALPDTLLGVQAGISR